MIREIEIYSCRSVTGDSHLKKYSTGKFPAVKKLCGSLCLLCVLCGKRFESLNLFEEKLVTRVLQLAAKKGLKV